MSFDRQTIYDLLPAVHRLRDAELGQPLEALLAVIAEQVAVLDEDLAQLYDDQFVETCAEWVVPYIGDLIGARGLHGVVPRISSPRAEVANTIGYRRRKGTAAMLEQLARDVTGWDARVVEFFELLGWAQYMQHLRVRPPKGGWLNLRDHEACEQIVADRGAFDPTAHTVDVRRIASRRGRYNIPNVGIFLWRLQAYPIERGAAREIAPGCYTFNPLGLDAPLFNSPQPELEITHLAEPINVAAPLRRRPLYDELEARRQAQADGQTPIGLYFGDLPVLSVFTAGSAVAIPAAEVLICDLSDPDPPIPETWRRPPASQGYQPKPTPTQPNPAEVVLPIQVAVDPVLGRLAFPSGVTPASVEVSYAYGFADDLGGGPYDREEVIPTRLAAQVSWQIGVSQEQPAVPNVMVGTLAEAVQLWNARPAGTVGVITIHDSRSYQEDLTAGDGIVVPAGSQLAIVAATWPGMAGPAGPNRRPHLRGSLEVVGGAPGPQPPPPPGQPATEPPLGGLLLNGLLIEGTVTVLAGDLGSLDLVDATIAPGFGSLTVQSADDGRNDRLSVGLTRAICGPISLAESVPSLRLATSIVDGGSGEGDALPSAIEAPGTDVEIEASTILGTTGVRTIEASNSIFLGRLVALRRQAGCVRFCFLPLDSLAPRRYRCQPASAADASRVRPIFTSRRYGDPGYCQLAERCADAIQRGADDESEMGVFHDLYSPQRETNLQVRLDEYLRFGLEAGIIYAS